MTLVNHVTTLYAARIDYCTSLEAQEAVENKAFHWQGDLEVTCNHGGPCHFPYIEVTGENRNKVLQFVGLMERYIFKRKGILK